MGEEKGERWSGVVTRFFANKGFGFIKVHGDDDNQPNLFVHQSEVRLDGYRTLHINQEVEFDIVLDDKNGREKASDVTPPGGGTFDSRSQRRRTNTRRSNQCYNCRGAGHLARDCPSPRTQPQPRFVVKACGTCGQKGHFSKDCLSGGRGSGACYNCNQQGHFARECQAAVEGGGGRGGDGGDKKQVCFLCGKPGHTQRVCSRAAPVRHT